MYAATQLPFSTHLVHDPCQGMVPPTVGSSSHVNNTSKIIRYIYAQSSISQVILDSNKLTVNTSYHIGHSGSQCGEESSL